MVGGLSEVLQPILPNKFLAGGLVNEALTAIHPMYHWATTCSDVSRTAITVNKKYADCLARQSTRNE